MKLSIWFKHIFLSKRAIFRAFYLARLTLFLRHFFPSFLLVLFISLTGCTSPSIYEDDNFNPPVYFGSHRVEKGDTLYSIAWRYGRDFKELARANDISPPYVIHVGDKIRLNLRAPEKKTTRKKSTSAPSKPNMLSADKTVKKELKNVKQTTKKTPKYKKLSHQKANMKTRRQGGVEWQWPYVGKIIAEYNPTSLKIRDSRSRHKFVNKGIDIKGKMGDPVYAAANGEVVYAGNGLRGYGNLIILNHNEHFLSAYAHNKKILVKEGQKIKRGDMMATMGNTGTQTVKLHFEVRKDGRPVNPLSYLPSR